MAHAGSKLVLGLAVVIGVCMLVDSNAGSHAATDPPLGGARYAKPVVGGTVTSGFGPRWGEFHGGLDIAAPLGTPIRAVAPGTVIVAGEAGGFGLWMQVRHPDGTVTVYGHMQTIDRAVGAHVAAGERIATVGHRGEATGDHLHIEVWPHGQRAQRVDPRVWLDRRGIHY